MHLCVTRLDDGRHETLISRRDGVCYHVKGVGQTFAIPHDLAHLAIEEALGLHRGFWGSVAEGAVFASMYHVSGRRRPGAVERSRAVLRANRQWIKQAEDLARTINEALHEGLGPQSPALRARLRNVLPPPDRPVQFYTDGELEAVCAAWRRMLALWEPLPVGGTLSFTWAARGPDAPARATRSRRHPTRTVGARAR